MKTTNKAKVVRPRKWFQRRRHRHDPRKARSEGSQFAQPVHVPDSFRRLVSIERAAAGRRSGDPMLVLSLSTFNWESGWNRIFNRIPNRETVWS
jgi:hypothetical protein